MNNRLTYRPDPAKAEEYISLLMDRAEKGIITLDRRDAYIRYVQSGGEVFPDSIVMKSGKAKEDAKTRFRQQFRRQVR
jgi:hypothetical protein